MTFLAILITVTIVLAHHHITIALDTPDRAAADDAPTAADAETAPITIAVIIALVIGSIIAAAIAFATPITPPPTTGAAHSEGAGFSPVLASSGFEAGACEESASHEPLPLHTAYERTHTVALPTPAPTGRCEGAAPRASTYERTYSIAIGGARLSHRCTSPAHAASPFWKREYTPPTATLTVEFEIPKYDADGREIHRGRTILLAHSPIASPMWRH